MILTDDNFATIINAVEYGRALYDNLLKYLRFQMSTLVAYIATFLGAGIFVIAGGVPLNPLQILWLNMVIDIPIAIALGFDEPSGGLMDRKPRPLSAPVLSRTNWIRLTAQGLLMAIGALVAYQIGESDGALFASTMILTTLSFFHIVAGLLAHDQRNTIFTRSAILGTLSSDVMGSLCCSRSQSRASDSCRDSSERPLLTSPSGRSASDLPRALSFSRNS